MLDCWFACHMDMNKNKIILNLRVRDTDNNLPKYMWLFQEQFSNCRVTMATFYDDIVVGIASLFNSSMNCDIHENLIIIIIPDFKVILIF